MYLLFVTQENATRARVNGIHYMPHLLTPEQIAMGIEVESIPAQPTPVRGKSIVHYLNPATLEQWYELETRPLTQEETIEEMQEYIKTLEKMVIHSHKLWKESIALEKGEVINYKNTLYEVVQNHTTQADWIPPLAPALFMLWNSSDEPREWLQPLGAHDSYDLDERVKYQGKNYVSLIYNNVWLPTNATYWKEVDAEWNDFPVPEIPAWTDKNPDGSNKVYNIGDRVTFEGAVYESLIANNVWSPSAYPAGWKLIP